MTKIENNARELSVYAKSVAARIKHEEDVNKKSITSCVALANVAKLMLTVDVKNIADVLTKTKVNESFALDKRISTSMICMKALDRIRVVLDFTYNRSNKIEENVNAILRTCLNAHKANVKLKLKDFEDAIYSQAKISDDKKALIFKRANSNIDAKTANRQALLCERALTELKIITTVNDEFTVNYNQVLKDFEKRIAA